jgi:hypothetical protein
LVLCYALELVYLPLQIIDLIPVLKALSVIDLVRVLNLRFELSELVLDELVLVVAAFHLIGKISVLLLVAFLLLGLDLTLFAGYLQVCLELGVTRCEVVAGSLVVS